ncbi:MAG: sialate O-acetylesterase, partial [Draconibacterium sp.]
SGLMKMNIRILIVSFLAVFVWVNCSTAPHSKNQVKKLDTYLLIGQSNMAGRAAFDENCTDTLTNVFLFVGNPDHEWEGAAVPMNKYSTVRKEIAMQKLNMGYSFAKTMHESDPCNHIGLVVIARGGTSIDLWMPGQELYNEAVKRAKAAMEYGNLKGILWHQGESDASKQQYMPKLLELVRSLRTDLGNAELPFVAGQLSKDKSARKNFNDMILTLPANLTNAAVVLSDSTSTIDSTHFDTRSQYLLGVRYANKMKKLVSNR